MSSRGYTFDKIRGNGVYPWIPGSNSENLHELVAEFVGTPTAGTLSVRARPRNSADFIAIDGATLLDLTEPVFVRFTGNVEEYEFTVAGLTGASAIAITDLASDGDPLQSYSAPSPIYSDDGGMLVSTVDNGHLCTGNSTEETLAIGGVFEGPYQDTLNFNVIIIGIISTQNSATDGLVVQWSADGVTVTQTDEFTLTANAGKVFTFSPANRYMSVKLTNGAVEADINIQTIFKKAGFKASSHRLADSIVEQDDAELVKAVLSGLIADDGFVNIGASATGNLKTTDAENGLAIAKGEVVGTTFVHKFGNAPDFDTGDGEVTVWDGAEDGTAWELMNYVYSTTDDIDSLSSSSAADTQDITITGLDVNYVEVTQTITLTGQTRVALDTPLLRVYRAFNGNSVDLDGHVIIYVNTALTLGVPTDKTKIRAIIDPVNQQTEMAVYTVPAGKTGYVRDWYASTAGANRDSNYPVKLKARIFGAVFRMRHTTAVSDSATSAYQHKYEEPEVFPEKTDIEMTVSAAGAGVTAAAISAGFDIVLVDN